MQQSSRYIARFVHAVIRAGEAVRRPTGSFAVRDRQGTVALDAADVRALVARGVLQVHGDACRVTAETVGWLKRWLCEADAYAAQHRVEGRGPQGERLNLAESPLARLAVAHGSEAAPFLEKHQVEAGERVRRLAERARLSPRLTMNYSGAQVVRRGSPGRAGEISDSAADARKALGEIHRLLPADCAGVVLDVCGLLKGLQVVEAERGWPRRSAKLVLRIGLEQLAQHYGLAPLAVGVESGRRRAWMEPGARPLRFE